MTQLTPSDEHTIKTHVESLNNLQLLLACAPHLKARREYLESAVKVSGLDPNARANMHQELFRLHVLDAEILKRVFHQETPQA